MLGQRSQKAGDHLLRSGDILTLEAGGSGLWEARERWGLPVRSFYTISSQEQKMNAPENQPWQVTTCGSPQAVRSPAPPLTAGGLRQMISSLSASVPVCTEERKSPLKKGVWQEPRQAQSTYGHWSLPSPCTCTRELVLRPG